MEKQRLSRLALALLFIFLTNQTTYAKEPASETIPKPWFKVSNWDSSREPLYWKSGNKYTYYIVHRINGNPEFLEVLPTNVGKNKAQVRSLRTVVRMTPEKNIINKNIQIPKKGFFLVYEAKKRGTEKSSLKEFYVPNIDFLIDNRKTNKMQAGRHYPITKKNNSTIWFLDDHNRTITAPLLGDRNRGNVVKLPWNYKNNYFDNTIRFKDRPFVAAFFYGAIFLESWNGVYFVVGWFAVAFIFIPFVKDLLVAVGEKNRAVSYIAYVWMIAFAFVLFFLFLTPTAGTYRGFIYRGDFQTSATQAFHEAGYRSLPMFEYNAGQTYWSLLEVSSFATITHPIYLIALFIFLFAATKTIFPIIRVLHYHIMPSKVHSVARKSLRKRHLMTPAEVRKAGEAFENSKKGKVPDWVAKNNRKQLTELEKLYEKEEMVLKKMQELERAKNRKIKNKPS